MGLGFQAVSQGLSISGVGFRARVLDIAACGLGCARFAGSHMVLEYKLSGIRIHVFRASRMSVQGSSVLGLVLMMSRGIAGCKAVVEAS